MNWKEFFASVVAVGSRFRWIVLAFVWCGAITTGLLTWQLSQTSPDRWCAVAKVNDIPEGCFQVLLHLIDVKDHTIIGLLAILGFTVLAVVVVTLKVKIDATGLGGGVNIGSENNVP